ncbi:MAG: hypothetical protein NTY70_17575 [Burkholderiales bacterium]|nr:hypothetical protein [Burkholderiales bacterium]
MRKFLRQDSLLIWLTFILITGFVAILLTSYIVSKDSLQQGIAEKSLPITGDSVYSEIQKDILRPVFISAQMAQDTFLRDWIINAEEEPALIDQQISKRD